ncbi:unnamed protein product [Oikopleura dioica]|uniref:DH domain-containing protein n=1 Tax=Oikopleura dioica TaxID=34765 RepID=E4XKJ4_OIKDI|nr:unnamed protein product [Oikopleura dioica]
MSSELTEKEKKSEIKIKILETFDIFLPKAQGLNLAVNVTEVLRLESSWRDFLSDEVLRSLSKSEARFQEAVWEIILTEHNYISKLHSAIHVYIGCLINLQEDDMFEKVQIKKLFTNLKLIYRTHLDLWTNFFLPELKSCRKNKRVLDASSIIPIYGQIEERIPAVYVNYLVGARDSIEYMRELCDEDELFRRFIDWAEDKDALQPEKNKCKGNDKNALDSILSGPHQRITRYGLLLETVCKLAEEPIKKKLEETRVKASALCLWIDRRVSLEDLRRTVISVEIDDFRNLSETTSDFLANHFAARGAFDFFSPVQGVKEEVQRRVYFEDSGIMLKDGEHKNAKIFVVILTDVLKRVQK